MSLNGLDDAAIKETHESAVAEPGGWFLLKYASRDEVDIYSRGTGGIVEMRNAIANYEEVSPLYGLLRYRRRNVILKYQPEDCSRLVQARAAVHFNVVCERFAPYNTTFEIATAKELKDTKLSAACSLHAASGSTSSSTSSLRRRRLMEITEEEEEEERERKRQSIVQEERTDNDPDDPQSPSFSTPEPPVVLDSSQITSQKEPNFLSTTEPPNFEGIRPPSPAKSDFDVTGRRMSSQSTRPDLYSYSTYTYGKPKVKLGPRPSLEANKRPQTAGNFRPIAQLPAGFKSLSKSSKKGQSEKTIEDLEHSDTLTPSISIPEAPRGPDTLLPRRPATSSGASIKSVASRAQENKMTPEKARLMKAMKLREQKKLQSMLPPDQPSVAETPIAEAPAAEEDEAIEKEMAQTTHELESAETLTVQDDDGQLSMSNADSGIAIEPPTPVKHATEAHTEDASTDSHPPSPTAVSSEVDNSTKASSLSELTDETIQPIKKAGEPTVEDDRLREEAAQAAAMVDDSGTMVVTDTPQIATPASQNAETHEETHVLAQAETPISEESGKIPVETTTLPEMNSLSLSDNETPSPTKSPYGLPVSKFSANDSKSPSLKSKFSIQDIKAAADPVRSVPSVVSPLAAPTPVAKDNEAVREEKPLSPLSPESRAAPALQSSKQRAAVEPIRTNLTAKDTPPSELSDPLLDDDALMDELQSATVQEAQPIMVSKSPINPVFPSTSPKKPSQSESKTPQLARAVSQPMRGQLLVPGDVTTSSARSVSAGGAAYIHQLTRQSSNAGLQVQQAKKGNLGSSISQRIKALEQLSGKDGHAEQRPKTAASTSRPTSTFFTVRKQNARDGSRSPSVLDRTHSFTPQIPTPERSREGSPEAPGIRRERSGSVASRLSMFEAPGANPPRGRPESIQVTARIIREPNQSFLPRKGEARKDPAEYSPVELKQSPLVVDHQKAEPAVDPTKLPVVEQPKETIQERRLSRDRKAGLLDGETEKKRTSSLNIVKEFIKDRRSSISNKTSTDNLVAVTSPGPASSIKLPSRPPSAHQNAGGLVRRLSISSRHSSVSKDRDVTSPTKSVSGATDVGSGDDDKSSEKKSKSRASRFLRRLSNSFGSGRKSTTPTISPTVAEEDASDVLAAAVNSSRQSLQPSISIASYMGDVNVQFPDTLLWKRRSMCLDSQGFLILSAVQGAVTHGKEKMGFKRYHLSEFRAPYTPDVEVQELPNSVVLDFMDGSGIQIACEDRPGQLHILHALEEAHQKYTSFGR